MTVFQALTQRVILPLSVKVVFCGVLPQGFAQELPPADRPPVETSDTSVGDSESPATPSQPRSSGGFSSRIKAFQATVLRAKLHQLYGQRRYAEAANVCKQILEIQREAYPDEKYPNGHRPVAITLFDLATMLEHKGDLQDARRYFEEALTMFRKLAAVSDDPDMQDRVAECLNRVGLNLQLQGKYSEAEKHLLQALDVRRQLHRGGRYPQGQEYLITSLNNAGLALRTQGNYEQARKCFAEAIEMLGELYPEDRYPQGHDTLATSLANMGVTLDDQGDHVNATRYLRQALDMRRRLYPKNRYPKGHPSLVPTMNNLGFSLAAQGKHDEAVGYFQQGVDMVRGFFPPDQYPQGHPALALSLNNLAGALDRQGKYGKARAAYEEALTVLEGLFPPDKYPRGHPHLALSLSNLGTICAAQGQSERVRRYFEQALAMQHRLYPADTHPQGHPDMATTLTNLASVRKEQGDYESARQYGEQSLAMWRRLYPRDTYPKGHPRVAAALNNLASLLLSQGEAAKALQYYKQAGKMRVQLYPPEEYPRGHPDVAEALNNLAVVWALLQEYDQAEKCYEQALAMWQQIYPRDRYPNGHDSLNLVMENLGGLYADQGKVDLAAEQLENVLAVGRQLYPADRYPQGHPALAANMGGLAYVLWQKGDYGRARELGERRLAMLRQLYPEDEYPLGHLDVAAAEARLAETLLAESDFQGAAASLERAARMQLDLAETFVAAVSEAESLNFVAQNVDTAHALVSVWRHTDRSIDDLYALMWRRHGLIQRAIAQRQRVIQNIETPEVRALYERYQETRQALAGVTMTAADPDPKRAKIRRERLGALTEEKETLERQLAGQLSGLDHGFQSHQRQHSELVETLPVDAAFIDLMHYVLVDYKQAADGRKTQTRVPSYVAFVLSRGEPVVRVDLGPAATIDAAVVAWREEIGQNVQGSRAAELRHLVWSPLREHLPAGIATVYLCPDGSLTGLPWAALPGSKSDSVLLEHYAFCLVPHGPLLSALKDHARPSAPGDRVLAVGDVAYDTAPRPDRQPLLLAGVDRSAADGGRHVTWPYLPGTKQELESVRSFAGNRPFLELTGAEASTVRVLTEMHRARWAVLATHGFFADPHLRSAWKLDESAFQRSRQLHGGERTSISGRNPLVLSGLVFAGANLPRPADQFGIPQGDGGILTAEAIAGLPLQNLDLAVLSACETGLGDVAGGEGVYGLQRAFHIAGAGNVMASLWKVDDQATAALMRLFFHKLWQEGKPPLVALREAKLALYRYPDQISQIATTRAPDFGKRVRIIDGPRETPATGKHNIQKWAAFVISGSGR